MKMENQRWKIVENEIGDDRDQRTFELMLRPGTVSTELAVVAHRQVTVCLGGFVI